MTDDLLQWRKGAQGFLERVNGPLFNRLPVERAPDGVVAPRCENELIQVYLGCVSAMDGIYHGFLARRGASTV